MTAGSLYDLGVVRHAHGWRITRFALRNLFTTGDRDIWTSLG